MTRDQLIIGEKIFDAIYELRDKQADRYDKDRLISVGDTNEDKLNNSLYSQAYNQGYRQALEDVLNVINYKK